MILRAKVEGLRGGGVSSIVELCEGPDSTFITSVSFPGAPYTRESLGVGGCVCDWECEWGMYGRRRGGTGGQ